MADKPRLLQAAAYRYNCQPCKQRKTKCDRVRPCASCHLRGTQDKCYVDEDDGESSPAGPSAATSRDERPQKKARFSNTNARPSPGSSLKSVRPRASLPSDTTASLPLGSSQQQISTTAIKEHIEMLRKTIDQLEASILLSSSTTIGNQSIPPMLSSSSSSSQLYSTSATCSSADSVLTNNDRLCWRDVAHLFPPRRDVDRILDYFLREMVHIMTPVQGKQLWRSWIRLVSSEPPATPTWQDQDQDADAPQQGISRPMVGSLLMCLASTSLFIPQRREEELELSRPLAEQRDHWITCALALARCGAYFSDGAAGQRTPSKPWMHYVDAITDASLDRFGFETLAMRMFALLGMSEVSYHINGECLRRAIRINLFDESSTKAAELLTVDDDELTEQDVVQMRRRIGAQMVVSERWMCLYTGRPPMIDEEASTLPLPSPGEWFESEEIAFRFSRYVSKLRQLPAQLSALTTRKPGDWSSQRARDQEAVQRVLDMDRGLCAIYDPTTPRPSMNGRSHAQILSDLPEILDHQQHSDMSDSAINRLHRDFAEALIMTSSWLSLRCLVTSNLMFLPWVGDVASRYYALNLARRLIELLPSIWMMAKSAYVPFSSSWISRHLFLACTVLSVPILGQEPAAQSVSKNGDCGDTGSERAPAQGDAEFAPSRMQSNQVFSNISTYKILESNSTAQRLPASSSVDLDWFSSKLVEIASLFSKLAERGDQTAGVNTKLIHALLNGRAELRDRVLDKLGQKQQVMTAAAAAAGEVRRIESQRDLTTFVMAVSVGKSPGGSSGASPATAGSPGRVGSRTSNARKDLASTRAAEPTRVASPSLHDLANAVDKYTNSTKGAATPTYAGAMATTPALPSFSPQPAPPQAHQSGNPSGIGWDWDKAVFPTDAGNPTSELTPMGDAVANIPSLFLDTQDWFAILDGVDFPL